MGGGDGADEGVAGQFTSFDAGFLVGFELVEGERNGRDGSEDGDNWQKDGKN